MIHTFDSELAQDYGLRESIVFSNIAFWVKTNESENRHYHDGRYWTYNSIEGLTKFHPYITKDQMVRVLQNLVNQGLIIKGNYNDNPYDRTCWYALSDKATTILQSHKMQFADSQNSNCDFAKSRERVPIDTDINTDIKHSDNKSGRLLPRNISKRVMVMTTIRQIINVWTLNRELQSLLMQFFQYVKKKKGSITEAGAKQHLEDFEKLVKDSEGVVDEEFAILLVKETLKKGWASFWEIPDLGKPGVQQKAVKDMSEEERKKFESDLSHKSY